MTFPQKITARSTLWMALSGLLLVTACDGGAGRPGDRDDGVLGGHGASYAVAANSPRAVCVSPRRRRRTSIRTNRRSAPSPGSTVLEEEVRWFSMACLF